MTLPFAPGQRLPDVRLGTMGGNSVTLSQFRGRKSLIWVWGSWDASRERLGLLQNFHRKHPEVAVVTIACDAQGVDLPMRYVAAVRGTFEMWMDATCALVGRWGLKQVGVAVLVDEDLGILKTATDVDDAVLADVETLLGKAPEGKGWPEPKVPPAPKKLEFLVQQCTNYLTRRRVDDAAGFLQQAIALDPSNRVLPVQILALKEPDRFYKGAILTS